MMKKLIPFFAFASLFAGGAADAASTELTITGVAQQDNVCHVNLSESTVSLLAKSETLIKQGEHATAPTVIHASIDGAEKCITLMNEGKMAFKFHGTADNADGTVLSNVLTDSSAASGVGIGIFDETNTPIAVNSGVLTAKADTVFGLQMVQLTGHTPVEGNINSIVTVDIERL